MWTQPWPSNRNGSQCSWWMRTLTEKPSHRLFRAPANLDNTTSAARHLVLHPLPRVAAKQVHTQEYSPVPTRPLQNVNIIAQARQLRIVVEREQIEAKAPQGHNPWDGQRLVSNESQAARSRYCSYSSADLIWSPVRKGYISNISGVERAVATLWTVLVGIRVPRITGSPSMTSALNLDMLQEFRRHQDGVCAPLEPHEGVAKERVCYSLERRAAAGEPLRFHRCPFTRLRDIDALSVDPHTNFSPRGAGRPNHVKQRVQESHRILCGERHGCGADGEDGYTRGPQASSRRGTPASAHPRVGGKG